MTNLEDILEVFASRYGRCNLNNSGNAPQRVGKITLDKVVNDDDVDLVAVLRVHLPQRISLSGSRDSGEALNTVVNRKLMDFLTLGRGIPLSAGVPKCVSRCNRIRR